jgi:hypothetical protein
MEETKENKKLNVIPLSLAKSKEDGGHYLKEAAGVLQSALEENATGFICLVFAKNDDPKIIWAGDLDLINAVGTLEMAKCTLLQDSGLIP